MCPCSFLICCVLFAGFVWLRTGALRCRRACVLSSPLFAFARQRPLFAGLWSQRNLCLPCVCRVVSPAFGVSKSTFVMPTHFQLRARSTRVVAARRVFAKLSRLSRAVRPGGRQRRGSTRRGAQRARFPLPRHTRPRQAIQDVYMGTCTPMVLRYDGLSESSSSSLFHGRNGMIFLGGKIPKK